MQTRPYTELYELVQALCGVVFASIEEPRIKALVNRRATRAYKASNYWTRFLRVGEQRDVVDGIIPFEAEGFNGIDTFLRIFPFQPYKNIGGGEYEFTVGPFGAELLTGPFNPEIAWVIYKAQKSGTYGSALTNDPNVPEEWFEYMAHGAYADYLRAEGQQEKAALADQEANEILLDELMKLDEQHTQTIISNRIFTNSSMQSRYGFVSSIGANGATGNATPIEFEDGEIIITEG
jgi:hypothetical protein